ncbi:UNVERIFIED_CONTAM: hypothetical protein Slati_2589800 [Sesamum latifolium]|uniref:Uncharacterized protein n=1 Tax=Sesamum latifolium TaxID=2727402 RepID=A0AAW2VWM7_9LAMI
MPFLFSSFSVPFFSPPAAAAEAHHTSLLAAPISVSSLSFSLCSLLLLLFLLLCIQEQCQLGRVAVSMERKQGFFSALKEEVVRGLSPARSRRGRSQSPSGSGLLRRRRGSSVGPPEMFISRSGSLRPGVETLSPLREGPDPNGSDSGDPRSDRWVHWLCRAPAVSTAGPGYSRSDLRLLLGVLGAPLAPVHVSNSDPLPHLCIKDTPIVSLLSTFSFFKKMKISIDCFAHGGPSIEISVIFSLFKFLWILEGLIFLEILIQETSSAQYILQQYLAASGGHKLQNSIQNAYAMGKVKMLASDIETATKVIKNKNSSKAAESGGFVLWQMNPDMWYVELALGGSKVHAGCNGKLVWRHTPWLGAHAAKGPVRPLRRALQGLDPRTTANMFVNARCTGEKKINGEDCFILKLCADPHTLKSRSEGPAEIIRHVLFGYFSQKTGLLAFGGLPPDPNPIQRGFGETAMSHTKTRMEEAWTIEEVAFNVPGLSIDCFIPPAELRFGSSISETCELPQDDRVKNAVAAAAAAAYRAKANHGICLLGLKTESPLNNFLSKKERKAIPEDPEDSERQKAMVLTSFNGAGVGFGFGVGCGFGVGWGFGGMPLNILGLGAGGGCGIGIGLGWGFGSAFGSQYHNSRVVFQGIEFESKTSEEKDSMNLLKNTQKIK